VLAAYEQLATTAPRELTAVTLMRIAPPAPWLPKEMHGQPMVGVLACYTGAIEEGQRLLAPLRAVGKPVADICVPRPYTQLQGLLDATQPKGRRYYWKSEYFATLGTPVFDVFRERAAAIASPHSAVIFFQLGGALNELPADHSPVGNRDAAFVLNVAAAWDDASEDDAHIGWARDTHAKLKPFSTGGVYINFLTEDEGADRTAAAYGGPTLARLAELKRKYDPTNLFRHTKSFGG